MKKKNADTLNAIFATPVLANVKWSDIVSLFVSLGASVTEERRSRVKIYLNDRASVFIDPHPEKELSKDALILVRHFLEEAGIKP